MKKNFYPIGALLLLLAACQRSPLPEQTDASAEEGMVTPETPSWRYSLPLGGVNKSTMGARYVVWQEGDTPGFYAGTTLNKAGNITLGEPCIFHIETQEALTAGTLLYGYHPYSETAGSDPSSVTMNIPSFQLQTATTYDADAMPQVFLPYTLSEAIAAGEDINPDTESLRLCNLGALARFEIFSTDAGEAGVLIYRVCFRTNEPGVCGSFDFDLTGVDSEAVLEDDYSSLVLPAMSGDRVETGVCELPAGDSKANAAQVWMVVAPGTFSGTVTVMTNRGDYEWTLSSREFLRNSVKVLGLDLHHAHRSALRKVEIVAGSGASNTAGRVDGDGSAFRAYAMQEAVPAPDGESFWILERGNVSGKGFGIRRFNASTGTTETLINSLVSDNASFIQYPWSGDFDADGNFWFVNKGSTDGTTNLPSVGKITESDGTYSVEQITDLDEILQTLKNPMGLKFDADGNMFILCRITDTSKLLKFDSALNLTGTYDLPGNTACLDILPDKSRLLAGPTGAPANLLLINPADGTYEVIAGRPNGQTHTDLTGTYAYTDGTPGNPLTARVRSICGFAVDDNGWIWFTEGGNWTTSGVAKYHGVIRVLIPDDTGDYTKGSIRTMAGIPYSQGYTWTHPTWPLVRSWSDLSNFAYPTGIFFYQDALYILEGVNGNRISRMYVEKHFDEQDGTELWSYDETEAL